jgi:hypothetical protein
VASVGRDRAVRANLLTKVAKVDSAWGRIAGGSLPVVSDRLLAIDLLACVAVSVAICAASDRPALMSLLVPAVLLGRFLAWKSLALNERGGSVRAEAIFWTVCTLLGAVNDWNSVVRHRIYDYDVPVYFRGLSTVPFWMLLYWGLVLRSLASLARWARLSPARVSDNGLRLPGGVIDSAVAKLAIEGLMVIGTRQCIYRWYLDPLWSWLPFAFGVIAYALLFPRRHADVALSGIVLCGGPAVEMLYIHVGRLHHYHLGWIGGVPLWIALWWVLAAWVWSDIAPRLQRFGSA